MLLLDFLIDLFLPATLSFCSRLDP